MFNTVLVTKKCLSSSTWLRFATTQNIVKIAHYFVFVRTQKTEAVGEPIQPVLKTLETLNLGENNLQNRGIHTLRESLMMNHSLLQLELKHTHITCEGAVALAEFLAESRQIQRLDVRENEVRAGGLMALSLALRINHSLTSLDLDHTPKQEQEDFLMETQKSLLREISELCMGNAARHRIATETELPRPDSSEAH